MSVERESEREPMRYGYALVASLEAAQAMPHGLSEGAAVGCSRSDRMTGRVGCQWPEGSAAIGFVCLDSACYASSVIVGHDPRHPVL